MTYSLARSTNVIYEFRLENRRVKYFGDGSISLKLVNIMYNLLFSALFLSSLLDCSSCKTLISPSYWIICPYFQFKLGCIDVNINGRNRNKNSSNMKFEYCQKYNERANTTTSNHQTMPIESNTVTSYIINQSVDSIYTNAFILQKCCTVIWEHTVQLLYGHTVTFLANAT